MFDLGLIVSYNVVEKVTAYCIAIPAGARIACPRFVQNCFLFNYCPLYVVSAKLSGTWMLSWLLSWLFSCIADARWICDLEPFSIGLNSPQAVAAWKRRRCERAENQSGNKTKKPCKVNLAGLIWWSVLDSNQWPHRCERCALPTEPTDQVTRNER